MNLAFAYDIRTKNWWEKGKLIHFWCSTRY